MSDEKIIVDVFQKEFNITLQKIHVDTLKAADFYGLHENKKVFVAEVKSFKSLLPSEETKYERLSSGILSKKSNEASKISEKIDEACKQLKNYVLPRVVIFFNHEFNLQIDDLDNAYYGYHSGIPDFDPNTPSRDYSLLPPTSKNMVKKEYREIDLYIWIDWGITQCDAETSKMSDRHNQKWFCYTNERGEKLAESFFKEKELP